MLPSSHDLDRGQQNRLKMLLPVHLTGRREHFDKVIKSDELRLRKIRVRHFEKTHYERHHHRERAEQKETYNGQSRDKHIFGVVLHCDLALLFLNFFDVFHDHFSEKFL